MTIFGKSLLILVRTYQKFVSPFIPARCRFYPSCSQYAAEAIERHGAFKGSVRVMTRLARCHPWHPGGHDPAD